MQDRHEGLPERALGAPSCLSHEMSKAGDKHQQPRGKPEAFKTAADSDPHRQ